MSLLELRGVSKRYGGVQALDEVSFAVEAGSIVGLMGANGAGKTTLFALVAGNERPSAGDILWKGDSLVGLRPDQISRRGVARTFQIVRPFAGLSVLENAAVAAMFGTRATRGRAEALDVAHEALRAVGLDSRAEESAGDLTLSGQKRLEIARALATGASMLMLDEVMAGLTPAEVERMLETLRELRERRGLTLLVIEHVMRALMQLSDRIVVLHLGRRIADGTPREIAANDEVTRVYFGEAL